MVKRKPSWDARDWRDDDEYITVLEFKNRAKRGLSTIYRDLSKNKIPAVRFEGTVLINWSEFRRMLQRSASDATR